MEKEDVMAQALAVLEEAVSAGDMAIEALTEVFKQNIIDAHLSMEAYTRASRALAVAEQYSTDNISHMRGIMLRAHETHMTIEAEDEKTPDRLADPGE